MYTVCSSVDHLHAPRRWHSGVGASNVPSAVKRMFRQLFQFHSVAFRGKKKTGKTKKTAVQSGAAPAPRAPSDGRS